MDGCGWLIGGWSQRVGWLRNARCAERKAGEGRQISRRAVRGHRRDYRAGQKEGKKATDLEQ